MTEAAAGKGELPAAEEVAPVERPEADVEASTATDVSPSTDPGVDPNSISDVSPSPDPDP